MTYSIVAVDRDGGVMGAAVQSHYFSTGTVVPWVRPGAGVVATQAMVNVAYGPRGLACLEAGLAPDDVLASLTRADTESALRQVAMADCQGRASVHTGDLCIAEAGHARFDGGSCQANMMERDTVWDAMADAYESSEGEPFERRLLCALEAAQHEGGDIRGVQSGAIRTCCIEPSGIPWEDSIVDVRVDDSADPLGDLARLLSVRDAYALADRGDDHLGRGEIGHALRAYAEASAKNPENTELRFWHAVALAQAGEEREARALMAAVVADDARWAELLRRLPPSRILDAYLVDRLLRQ